MGARHHIILGHLFFFFHLSAIVVLSPAEETAKISLSFTLDKD